MAWLFAHLSKQDKETVHEFLVESLKEDDRDIEKKAVELMAQYYDKKWC